MSSCIVEDTTGSDMDSPHEFLYVKSFFWETFFDFSGSCAEEPPGAFVGLAFP